jgi:hypothetical protein
MSRRISGPNGKDIIYGTSLETKPTGEEIGTVFEETNTGKVWKCTATDTWTEDLTMIFAVSEGTS